MASNDRLGLFLREASNWTWDQFVIAEGDKTYTSNEAVIFALIRACALQKMDAIRISLNRLDGKLKTPVIIEYPKIFYLFPNAKIAETPQKGELPLPDSISTEVDNDSISGELVLREPKPEKKPEDLPSMSLRETLVEMANYPRSLPEGIVELAHQTDAWLKRTGEPRPPEIPKVKSVVAAHLLLLAQKRNIDALTEVFDQIDGKLAETIQLIGDDLYIISYLTTAPPGAYLNKDGIVEIEADVAQKMWATKLGAAKK